MEQSQLIYEKRNLGVDACKFVVNIEDNPDEFVEVIRKCNVTYQEAIIPINHLRALHMFEECGFYFMENSIQLSAERKQISIPRVAERFLNATTYTPANSEQIEIIKRHVESSGLFSTDKIALNPHFGKAVAGKRYRLWIEDMLQTGEICYAITYNDILYGFEIVSVENGNVELKLGSAFKDKGAGLSMITSTASYNYWKNSEVKKVTTNVSSNNLNILKLHEMYGLKVSNMSYVLSRYK